MDHERQALVEQICSTRDNQIHKAALADWCNANGEPSFATLIQENSNRMFEGGHATAKPMKGWYFKDGPALRTHEELPILLDTLPFLEYDPHSPPITAWFIGPFIDHLRLPWERWLEWESAMCWYPPCLKCEGTGEWCESGREQDAGRCPACNGQSPYFKRPFAPTVQPIRGVTLEDLPDAHYAVGPMDLWFDVMNNPGNHRQPQWLRLYRKLCRCMKPVVVSVEHNTLFTPTSPRSGCNLCGGKMKNKWTCDAWPLITFHIPSAYPEELNDDDDV